MQVLVTQMTQIYFCYKYPSHESMCQSPSDVYDNYVKDCLAHERYGLSYMDYMHNIIDNLILLNTSDENDTYPDQLDENKKGPRVGDVAGMYNIPNDISAHITECVNPDLGVHSDSIIYKQVQGIP